MQRNASSRLHLVPRPGPPGAVEGAVASGTAEPTLEDLYREHAAFVARLAFRLLGRNDDVDDVVHDVFLDLMRQLGTLDQREALRGWLCTVTIRAARKRLRRSRWRQMLGLGTASDYDQVATVDAPHEHRVMLQSLYRALERLPADHRLAWTLRHIEGEQLETVASRCGISLATAKRRISAAHDRLIRDLGAWTNS